jgi:hypothetical protein
MDWPLNQMLDGNLFFPKSTFAFAIKTETTLPRPPKNDKIPPNVYSNY